MRKMTYILPPRPTAQANAVPTFYHSSLNITYGVVKDVNKDLGTCDIEISSGFLVKNIKLLSTSFPVVDPISGGISYPQKESNVLLLFPDRDIKNGFILPAPLDQSNNNVKSDILGSTDKKILPAGWVIEYDADTGDLKITDNVSGNDSFELFVDKQNKEITLSDWNGNVIKTDSTKVDINGGNLEVLQ